MNSLGNDVKQMIRDGRGAKASQECLEFVAEHLKALDK